MEREWTAEAKRQAERARKANSPAIHCATCGKFHDDQIRPCDRALCPFWQDKEPA